MRMIRQTWFMGKRDFWELALVLDWLIIILYFYNNTCLTWDKLPLSAFFATFASVRPEQPKCVWECEKKEGRRLLQVAGNESHRRQARL